MNNSDKKDSSSTPAPEVLHAQSEGGKAPVSTSAAHAVPAKSKLKGRFKRGSYRPSHKATFIGLAVVVAILGLNGGVVAFIMQAQGESAGDGNQNEVVISPAVLDSLGVSRNPVGNDNTELVVGPNSKFSGNVVIGGDASVAGQLKLNSKLTASDAAFANLQSGDTSVEKLNVNGDATISTLNLRSDLSVVGITRLQGPVTLSQLLTVNNNVNIAGSLAVGGTLSTRNFQASSLTSDTTLTIGGHVITRGSAPGVGPGGPALGNNGTVSISGNDASGTVAANIGTGATSGIIAHVAFKNQYATTPHVVVTAVGGGIGSVYVNRTIGGFSIGVNSATAPGGYAFDYIVMQ